MMVELCLFGMEGNLPNVPIGRVVIEAEIWQPF